MFAASALMSTPLTNGAAPVGDLDSSSDEFFDAPSEMPGTPPPVPLPTLYNRVRNPDDAENAPDHELSLIKLAREVLGSVKAGADVTNVNLPASILDPVSTLEKTTKSMQRGDLLPDIVFAKDPLARLLAVLRFNLSGLAKERFGKKPYNPVLGEVFRCAFAHRKLQHGTTVLVAEQVSHHPPITALHLQNRALGVHLNSYTAPEPRFWGNSLEVKLKGCIRITLDSHDNEEYLITRPVVNMTGFLAGRQRLEFHGPAQIICEKSGITADLEFKARGMMGRGDQHAISGRVYRNGDNKNDIANILYTFDGFWDNEVTLTDVQTGETSTLFNYHDVKAEKSMLPILPAVEQLEPSFSTAVWAECSDAIWRAHTADANAAKRKVEDHQRELKKKRKEAKTEWIHHYFKKRGDGQDGYLLRSDVEQLLEAELGIAEPDMNHVRQGNLADIDAECREEIIKPEGIQANGGNKKGKMRRRMGTLGRRKGASQT